MKNVKATVVLLATNTLVALALLAVCDIRPASAMRPVVCKQGQGQDCECVLGVVFPSRIAAGNGYGTGSWLWYNANDPAAWGPFYDEDMLWIKVVCQDSSPESVPHTIPEGENFWAAETTETADPWFTGESFEEWLVTPGPYGYPENPWFFPSDDPECPCMVGIRTLLPSGVYIDEIAVMCPGDWYPVLSYLALPIPGGVDIQVTIVVRLVCGDCIVEGSQSVNWVNHP